MGAKSRTCIFIMTLQMINLITCQEVFKRVPQGFLGMRGKKYYDVDEPEHFYKRRPQFFVGVKGKKSIYDYLQSNYDQYYKRAPMGFFGMRGKKNSNEISEPNPFIPDSYDFVPKQGSLIGQIDYTANDWSQNEIDLPYLNKLLLEYLNQRDDSSNIDSNETKQSNESNNPQPFDEDQPANVISKRAARIHQFYGVRGKKAPENKRPFDLSFRGKFVGVRGKKDLKNSGIKEIKFLLDHEGPWPKRKGQMNGFFGMRGKKWTDESSPESEAQN